MVQGYLEYGPTFCLCSRGWVKAVFTEALGEEVEVELVKAIGRGDEWCEFVTVVTGDRRTAPSKSLGTTPHGEGT